MTPDRCQNIEAVFQTAVDLPPAERASFVSAELLRLAKTAMFLINWLLFSAILPTADAQSPRCRKR